MLDFGARAHYEFNDGGALSFFMCFLGGVPYVEASPMHDHSRSDFLSLALFLGLRAFVAAAASYARAASLRFQQCSTQPSSSCALARAPSCL